VLACLTLFNPELEVAWLSTGLALLLLALFDALQSRALPTPEVTRRVAGSVALGVWSDANWRCSMITRSALNYRANRSI